MALLFPVLCDRVLRDFESASALFKKSLFFRDKAFWIKSTVGLLALSLDSSVPYLRDWVGFLFQAGFTALGLQSYHQLGWCLHDFTSPEHSLF